MRPESVMSMAGGGVSLNGYGPRGDYGPNMGTNGDGYASYGGLGQGMAGGMGGHYGGGYGPPGSHYTYSQPSYSQPSGQGAQVSCSNNFYYVSN